MTTLQYI